MKNPRPWSRRIIFGLTVLSLPLWGLALIEGIVRLTGFGLPDSEQVQRMNPVGLPMFECREEYGNQVCRTTPWFIGFIGEQKFFLPKPPGTVRIFCLGESAVEGYPFHLPGSFPRLMQVMLDDGGRKKFEVINVAVRGIHASDIRHICAEIVRYQPDVVIIYLGNNEYAGMDPKAESGRLADLRYRLRRHFLGWRLFPVLVRIRMRLEPAPEAGMDFADAARATRAKLLTRYWDADATLSVARRFRANLEEMVALVKAAGAEPALATVAVNLRDFHPFPDAPDAPTDHCLAPRTKDGTENLSPAALQEKSACAAVTGWPADDRLPAATAYRQACCELWDGDTVRAGALLRIALERDRFKSRTTAGLNNIVRETAEKYRVPLVDVAAGFAAASPDGLPGDNLFLDYVHPNLVGEALLARLMIERLAAEGLISLDDDSRRRMQTAAEHYLDGLPADYLSASYSTLAGNLANYGMFTRSARMYRKALELAPDSDALLKALAAVEELAERERRFGPSLEPPR